MKLLKFSPTQIMENWPYIKECIALSLPPYVLASSDAMLRIQEQLLVEYLECWACVDDKLGELFGIVTTKIAVDDLTLTKNLLVFTITITEAHEHSVWSDGYYYLSKYATAKGCASIIAYTNQESVVALANSIKGDTSWRLLQFALLSSTIERGV